MMTRLGRTTPVSALVALGLGSVAFAGTHSPEFEKMSPGRTVDVIVTYASGADGSAITPGRRLSALPGGELRRMTVSEAMRVASMKSVAHTSVNHPILGEGTTAAPGYDYMPQGIQPQSSPRLGFQVLWQGQNVGVAVIDSGINTKSADLQNFGATVVYSESFVSGEDANDYFGHGTHVAGILAGTGISSLGFANDIFGVSPGVNLINLKVLDKNGMSDDATVIAAIDRAIQFRNRFKIKVINLSLGRPVFESFLDDPLCQEVEKAWLAGITVVVAAGNDGRLQVAGTNGYGTIASPGNDPLALTVGAINTEGSPDRSKALMTTYSSKGPSLVDHVVKPDLVAPGNKIFAIKAPGSLLADSSPYNNPGNYLVLSGTSMSAAVGSGAAAALLATNPWLTNNQVKARLMKTAGKLPNVSYAIDGYTIQNDIFTVGAGYLNLDAARSYDGPDLPSNFVA
ncbi:MAG: S8 family serine peptidase, partial [Acidobacteriota bacterium]|nr:S8 family serine peptidase [Acidobacteriota bacterium]